MVLNRVGTVTFIVFYLPLLCQLRDQNIGCHMNSHFVGAVRYADDECRKIGHRKKGHRKKGHGKKGTGKMGTGKKGTSEKLGKKGTLQKKTDIM